MSVRLQSVLVAVILAASAVVAVTAAAINSEGSDTAGKGDRLEGVLAASQASQLTITTPSAELTIITRVQP